LETLNHNEFGFIEIGDIGTDINFTFHILNQYKIISYMCSTSLFVSFCSFLMMLYLDMMLYAFGPNKKKFRQILRIRWGLLVFVPFEDIVMIILVGYIHLYIGGTSLPSYLSIVASCFSIVFMQCTKPILFRHGILQTNDKENSHQEKRGPEFSPRVSRIESIDNSPIKRQPTTVVSVGGDSDSDDSDGGNNIEFSYSFLEISSHPAKSEDQSKPHSTKPPQISKQEEAQAEEPKVDEPAKKEEDPVAPAKVDEPEADEPVKQEEEVVAAEEPAKEEDEPAATVTSQPKKRKGL